MTAYELDPAAIYGGLKEFPKARDHIAVQKYVCNPDRNPIYQKLESEKREILGLVKRAEIEGVKDYLTVIEENYYKNPPKQKYDAIFSSCSFQYSCNFDMRIEEIVSVIQNSVAGRGYVYLDYMMPLEECHSWRPEHYLRKGEMQKLFTKDDWKIIHIYEMNKPVFEAAHADRPEDHFHRFGYILAECMGP